MLTRRSLPAIGLALCAGRALAQSPPIQIAQVIPLSGEQATRGDEWRDGVEMAVQDVNRRGGILGRLLQVYTYDWGPAASAAGRGSLQRALETDPYALLGPFGEAAGPVALPRDRRLLQITRGADTAGGAVFLAGPSIAARMARLAAFLHDGVKLPRVGLLSSTVEAQRAAREPFLRAARAAGLDIAADVVVPPPPADPAAEIARLLRASPLAVFLDGTPPECGRLLAALRAQAPEMPVFGDATLIAPATLARAGNAAIGLRAHVALSGDAPLLRGFRDRFAQSYKRPPGPAAIEGHISIGMIKAATERLGRADPRALPDALRGLHVTAAAEPACLLDTTWGATGEPERVSFIAEVMPGGALAWQELPPA